MLRISIKILALLMLTISGCASFSELSNNEIPNVHIAYAHLLEDVESYGSEIFKIYQLDLIVRGRFPKDDFAYLIIEKETIPKEGLPVQAILILHYGSEKLWYDEAIEFFFEDEMSDDIMSDDVMRTYVMRTYVPLQNDAQKGILPDTPQNRQIVESSSLENLSRTPIVDQITMEQAIGIAKVKHERRDDMIYEYSAYRYPYGWRVFCDERYPDGRYPFGGCPTIIVGDDGEVKEIWPVY